MISMATPVIARAVGDGELGVFAVVLLILFLSAAEILGAEPDIRTRFAPFVETSSAIVLPLLLVFSLIVFTRVLMIL
ncbi:hypothetical protein FHEFKHOI_00245 [Candidatus Methanoperedenaceae archaeon GB50]|nr:hypothetical protein AIOGIFDO_00242 [Candidatus Methanoperedenaceae archaeon GB37]CAD7768402.1 hypothetical protein FHEFKHOI_00245 [Candidatus Methanoperedenaceae archaeon GB50]CAD7773538.1 MAG: hypothetical protein KBONHNOK_00615 [Candidatus Methanoperedenaceae archaeon GB50]